VNSEFGAYHVVRHIGGGGMAQIYLVKTRGLAGFEKHLALKVINPEYADEQRFVQMLIDEAKLAVGLSHVNIGQVFDLGQIKNVYYIAMEFVDGLDVLELVNGLHALGEKVPVEAVAYIGRQMCAGLHYAHTRKGPTGQPLNIVHRDISPQNILVSRDGEVKVVDFGIAKAAGMSTRTQAGVIKGKVHYMAPEQALGQKIDHRVDIFSSGIVLWEMLTSQMVYSGDNVRELVEKVRRAAIPTPSTIRPEVPPALDFIVMKALSRRADERFQTAHEFQIELTKFLSATAPDYSGSHLSALLGRVLASKRSEPVDKVDSRASKDDLIRDDHSVIKGVEKSGSLDEPTSPKDRPRLIMETDRGDVVFAIETEVIIGRAGNLAIPDARVSRRHARVYRDQDTFLVEDLGSSNGTYVNDQRISGSHTLQHDDVIRVGSRRVRFVAGSAVATPPLEDVPVPAVPRLIISCRGQVVESFFGYGQELPLSYQLQVGPLTVDGAAGRVVQREGGYWVEPQVGREAVTVNGVPASGPIQLVPGMVFAIGQVIFEYRE
jgi:serine/threonine protein kinase